ncbi:TrkA C-terminal domain-containing protein [Clostridium septicum]|uniref:GntR family transcriptional regulator n=1 Tax=Clostridium septicum TaxID=1504 RepID=A0A9N7JP10_CLOSE|nr:TrkA C-terminal domain-containing protein [Clostridium septicum]AYE35346.1 potassium transporter TrkA [Clostridium septicum]MDU1314858.1 TrkA C-terminal domain-containing protein [Clostridium septicum]QAS60737.1 GntR family transcriptional regulator [Clostridium septicum]UEC19998.1 GntR family transcriptional regulator [Clostridium septicum]USS01944.1 GntR family transcriptional regulator [Clostridium septicum]
MSKQTKTPNYIKIAVDIAHRIVNNDFVEGSKITGRTTLVSLYNVSPETIRRSLALLKDMDVVTVNEKSGIIINNKSHAKEFLNKFKTKSDFTTLNNETFDLIKQRKDLDSKLIKNLNSIIEFATQLRNVGSIIPFESIVEEGSIAVNKSIGELNFWHNTKATIIAVKRNGDLFLSPGPYFKIQNDDILVYVGEDEVLENVKNYISAAK